MTAPRPTFLGSSQGLTLLETAAVLLIVAILAVPLVGVASQLIVLPVEWQENLGAMRDAREALHLVASDARQAACFTEGTDDGEHGTFKWTDYTETPVRKFSVHYYLDAEGNLMREETVDDSPPRTTAIGHVEKFEIWQEEDRRLIRASVRNPSRAAEGPDAPLLKIAAMMRPDDPSDC